LIIVIPEGMILRKGWQKMNYVEVDATGLTKALAVAIVRRAMSVSSGKPVVVTFDDETVREHINSFANGKHWKTEAKNLPDGKLLLTMSK